MSESAHHEREHFFGAAKLVAALTLLSRVLGLFRDMVMIPLGGGLLADRFWLAFSIPNLFRRLFGEGALAAAFVPIFTETSEAKGWDRARLVLANVAGILAVCLAVILVLVWLGLWLAWEIFGGGELRLYLLQMIGLMMPFMFTVCMLALGSAALQCKGRFGYPAFAPIILNVVLIVTGLWIAPAVSRQPGQQLTILALAVVAAGVLQLFGVVLLLKRAGLAMTAITHIRPIQPEIKKMARLMIPMLIPLSALQISALADRVIALAFSGEGPEALLRPGVVRCLFAASRLYMLPLGVLAIPLATAVFPLFSRYAARSDEKGLCESSNRALRLCLFMGIPAGVGMLLISRPLIELIYQRKEFTSADTLRAASILQMYCLGMWAYFCNHILIRAFYAVKKPHGPMRLACLLVPVNIVLVLAGIHTPLRSAAVGLATTLTACVNALLLAWMLHRQWGQLGVGHIFRSLIRVLIATIGLAVAAGAVILFASDWIRNRIPSHAAGLLISIILAVVAGAGTYLLLTKWMRCPELHELRKKHRLEN